MRHQFHTVRAVNLIAQVKNSVSRPFSTTLDLSKLGRHQLVKLCIAWELIDKRDKGTSHFQKPLTCAHIRDIAHLQVGDIQELGKLQSVRGRLIEHDNKLTIGKHRPCCVALEQVVHILGNTRTVSSVFTHTLPEGKRKFAEYSC